jgi:serine/threonine-protein kinase
MALAMMPHYSGKLGDTLVGLGLLKPLEVFRHLSRQVRQKLIDVCTWSKGNYRWYPGRENPREAFPLGLQRYEVLGAGAMALSAEVVAAFGARLGAKQPQSNKVTNVRPEDFELGHDVRKLYDSLNGRHTVSHLADRYTNDADRTRFFRLLYLFINTGLATA